MQNPHFSILCLCSASILLACGDKDADDTGHTHEESDADTDTDTDTDAEPQTTAVVTTISSDYATGSFATVNLDSSAVTDELFVTSGDPAVSVDEGWVFQINRYAHDSVRLYESGSWGEPLWEQDMGDLSNPYVADICGGDLFVTLYGRDYIGVYDPASGTLKGTVDLSAFNDGDTVGPEAGAMVELGGKLYVGLNRLNRDKGWVNAGGMVVEVDCAAQSVTRSWSIGGNTVVRAWPGTDRLLVQAVAYGEDLGGLYALDPATETVELLVESPEGSFSSVAAVGNAAIATALASDYSHYTVYCIDLAGGVADVLEETSSYLTGIAQNDRGEAWVTAGSSWIDSSAPSGVFVYDIATCTAESETPISFSLYPFDVAFY